MRILHLESPNPGKEGDHVYRTRQPCRALGELPDCHVVSGSFLNPAVHAALERADVLVLCDAVDVDLLAVIEARRRAGRLTVYEINDHVLAPQAWSASAYLAHNPLLRSLSLQMAARSHAVQFSVAELDRGFGFLNPTRAVFENQLWDVPVVPKRQPDDGVRPLWLGWGGSLGHLEDLRWAMPALRAALDRHPRLGLSMMGPDPLRVLFADLPSARFRFTSGGSLERYYDFVAGLDLGVCPLLPTDFNRCRSDVKFLELASRGVPAICADLPPYAGSVIPDRTGLVFSDLGDLGQKIDRLVESAEVRTRLGDAAHAYVSHQRRERPHAQERFAQYQRWQAHVATADATANATDRDDGASFSTTEPGSAAFPDSTYQAWSSEVETALREGLVHAVAGRISDALRSIQQAQRQAPGFYLPALYFGTITPDAPRGLAALEEAQRLHPTAPNVALQRGLRLEALGRPDEARLAYQLCHDLLPSLGVGTTQLGVLAEAAGRPEEAIAHYETAVKLNPHYSPPVLALVARALAAGESDHATRLLETGLAHDPKLWRYHFLMGRVEGARGRWAPAEEHLTRALGTAPGNDRTAVLALLAKTQLARGNRVAADGTLTELRGLMAAAAAATRRG